MTDVLGLGGSELNRSSEVKDRLDFPDDVFMVDSTLRSLQSGVSGSRHTAADLVEIGLALDGLGVRELIVNVSWKDGLETVAGLAAARPRARIVATFRARNERWKTWLEDALSAGADEICFESAPDADYLRRVADLVHTAGRDVSHGFAEIYQYGEVVGLSRTATEAGYRSLSFHDSFFRLGIVPEAMQLFIRRIRYDVPGHPPLYVHLSNFYGQATMTAVAAIAAGANAADVCLNVTGHHCGHTSLSEVVMVLEDLYGVPTGINTIGLTGATELVRKRTGVPLPLTQPVIGEYAFMGDGAYWAAEAHLPQADRVHARFPFPPDRVGATERVVWSEKTATEAAIAARLRTAGLAVEERLVRRILAALTDVLEAKSDYPNWLTDAEFETLCRRTITEAIQ